jgi:hypothetical protein
MARGSGGQGALGAFHPLTTERPPPFGLDLHPRREGVQSRRGCFGQSGRRAQERGFDSLLTRPADPTQLLEPIARPDAVSW